MAQWKAVSLFSELNSDSVMTAQDSHQFMIVDGRTNNNAKMITIDQDGTIIPSDAGVPKPTLPATLTGFVMSNKTEEGLGIKKGKILQVCYTYKTEEGSESNPSPLLVIDRMQFMTKGYYTKNGVIYPDPIDGGSYTYDPEMTGSIEAVSLTVPVTESLVREVCIYVAESDYPESIIPTTDLRLVTTKRIPLGSSSVSVTLASLPSQVSASYENDVSPKGDDIALVNGISFIANSVNGLGLPTAPLKVWKIGIRNNNKYNYVNMYHRIDLIDDGGTKPVGETNFLSDLNWDDEDMSLIRLMDMDMTTPLAVYHYPLDSVVRVHESQSLGDGDFASLTVGADGSSSGFILTAKTMGTDGNSISVALVKQPGILYVFCSNEETSYITLQGATGVVSGSVTVVKPNSYNPTLSISVDGSNNATITLATANDSPDFTVVSDGDDINALLATAIAPAGALYGVYASKDDTYLVGSALAGAQAIEYISSPGGISVASSAITVGVEYSGSTILSTAASICALINSDASASALVGAQTSAKPGNGIVSLLTQTYLSGGSGTVIVNSAEIDTRMLAFIRIPILPAYSEIFIYMVKFETLPASYPGRFTQLVLANAGDNEMTLSNFYANEVVHNPIRNEECILSGNPDIPAELSLKDSQVSAMRISNRANSRWGITEGGDNLSYSVNGSYPSLRVYDELANADSLTTANPVLQVRRLYLITTEFFDSQYVKYETDGIVMNNQGYLAIYNVLPYGANTSQSLFMLSGTAFGAGGNGHIAVSRLDAIAGSVRIKIDGFFHYLGEGNDIEITDYLEFTFGTDAARDVFIVLSWDQVLNSGEEQGSQLDMVLYAIYDGKVVRKEISVAGARIETSGYVNVSIGAGTPYLNPGNDVSPYTAYYSLSLGTAIEDDWQAIALQRFMPLYPTEGIGAYNTFAINDDDQLSYSNENITIEPMSLVLDERPGRIQWGAYGAMPSLNEGSINEEILRIASLKSAMPTDEHNTILIFTKENVYRMALLGDNSKTCVIIPELMNTGLVHKDALCITTNGIAWMSRNGLLILEGSSLRSVSNQRIESGTVTSLRFDAENNWIWLKGDAVYVYQLFHDVWWKYSSAHEPNDFIGALNNAKGWVTYSDSVMYKHSTTKNTGAYVPKIVTMAYRLAKKLGRFNVIGSLISGTYKVAVKLYSMAIPGANTTTATYTGYYGKLTAIPGTSCDYAQIILTEIDGIAGIELENISGK